MLPRVDPLHSASMRENIHAFRDFNNFAFVKKVTPSVVSRHLGAVGVVHDCVLKIDAQMSNLCLPVKKSHFKNLLARSFFGAGWFCLPAKGISTTTFTKSTSCH